MKNGQFPFGEYNGSQTVPIVTSRVEHALFECAAEYDFQECMIMRGGGN